MSTINTSTQTRTTESNRRRTYWCHECDMSVSLFSSSSSSPPLFCPHCHSDFLEEMEITSSPNPNPSPSPNPNPNPNFSSPSQTLNPTTYEEFDEDLDSYQIIPSTLRLSNAYLLDRLIQHLNDPEDDASGFRPNHGSFPASKSSIESIPTIKITTSFLGSDSILCPICKDEFLIDLEVKQLPCNHLYHFDCILPWLSQHNSCPVCRYCFPTDEIERKSSERARFAVRFGNLMTGEEEEEEEGLFGMESTLRRIVRRHQDGFPMRSTSLGSSSSPAQMAEAEISSGGPTTSGETVSSFPVEGGSRGNGRLDEDRDTVMSGVREGILD